MDTSIRFHGFVLLLVCVLAACAAGNDAVSTTNFKAEGLYGNIDGLTGEISPQDFQGVGLHGFWRNRSLGLLGLTTSYTELADIGATRVGIEGEYHRDRFLQL